jgi:hypothetical protein
MTLRKVLCTKVTKLVGNKSWQLILCSATTQETHSEMSLTGSNQDVLINNTPSSANFWRSFFLTKASDLSFPRAFIYYSWKYFLWTLEMQANLPAPGQF